MISLELLLIIYGSTALLWCFILIYYLNMSIMSRTQPKWYNSIREVPESSLMILYGSIMLSPAFVFFSILLLLKKLLTQEDKER